MKKFLFLSLIFSAIIATTSQAQVGGGSGTKPAPAKEVEPAVMLKQMKEKICPLMVEKTGLTMEQANKVVELNFEMRMAAAGLRDLSESERSQKLAELKAAKEKKFTEFLTAEQIASVKTFYQEMGKK